MITMTRAQEYVTVQDTKRSLRQEKLPCRGPSARQVRPLRLA
jgi:hypothetical protein